MKFDAATATEIGPRATNEDEVAWWSLTEDALFGAIADGLGGMGGGGNASRIAVATLRRMMRLPMHDLPVLVTAAKQAHIDIVAAQKDSPELKRMATTLTAGLFSQQGLVGVHSGDTRASVARGSGVMRLTTDHSEGERLFKAGKLTKDDLQDYSRKNILDSALGVREQPKIDTFQFDLAPGDKVFFTTDGVHGKVLLREIRDIAEAHTSAQSFVQQISDVVMSRSPDDNFSIFAVFIS